MPFLPERERNCKLSQKRISSLRVHHAKVCSTFSHKQNGGRSAVSARPYRIGTPKRIRIKNRFGKRVSHNASGCGGKEMPQSGFDRAGKEMPQIWSGCGEKEMPQSKSGCGGKRRASMTLEAAMVLPLFLFTVLNLFAAVNDIALHVRMQAAMQQTGLVLARYAYAYERVKEGFSLPESELADVVFSQAYVKEKVEDSVGEDMITRMGVHGGAEGVSFLQSEILDGDTVTLVASYRMDALFMPEEIASFQMVNRVCLRKWTGYDNTAGAGGADTASQIVYITEYGEVYHHSRNCYHLNVTIRQTSMEKLSEERNQNGGRYTACELCGGRRQSGVLYVSEDGERYHTTAACSALRRTVTAIPLSEVGARSPCHYCGGLG